MLQFYGILQFFHVGRGCFGHQLLGADVIKGNFQQGIAAHLHNGQHHTPAKCRMHDHIALVQFQISSALCCGYHRTFRPFGLQLPDGRRGMKLTFKVPDPEGSIRNANGTHSKAYEMMLVWNADHPASADRLYGGSIRAYFSDPTYKEVMADFTCHGRPYVPHMLKDKHPVTGGELLYPCTAQTNKCQPETFCMTQAIGLAYNWLSQYTAAKYSSEAFAIMSRH